MSTTRERDPSAQARSAVYDADRGQLKEDDVEDLRHLQAQLLGLVGQVEVRVGGVPVPEVHGQVAESGGGERHVGRGGQVGDQAGARAPGGKCLGTGGLQVDRASDGLDRVRLGVHAEHHAAGRTR